MSYSGYTMDNLDDFVGKEVGVSDWMEISQQRIDDFAEVTEDRQWIHTDIDKAQAGPFGAPIAHGLLCLSLTVKLADEAGALPSGASMCVNYGFDRIRFPAPVKAGARIRCRATLLRVEPRSHDRVLLTTRYAVELEGSDKPAVVADCLGLFFR